MNKGLFKLGDTLFVVSALFYVVYNTSLGWNKTPESDLEESLDAAFCVMVYLTAIFYMMPLAISYREKYSKK